MKKLEIVVKPFRLDAIKEALVERGIDGMTVSEVRGLRHEPVPPGGAFEPDYIPRMKLEIIVPDELVDEICAAVHEAAADREGPQRIVPAIFIVPVQRAIRIRTGESEIRRPPES